MSGLKKISAPALSPQYGENVEKTFDNIQENFDVLANRELYKGDAGRNLITANVSWSEIFTSDSNINVSVDGVTYVVKNFADDITTAFRLISSDDSDLSAAESGLKNSGNVTICFEDKDTSTNNPTIVLSSIPFVFMDLRFRQGSDFSSLEGKTDMSCVITCTGDWSCIQNFPTLYYNQNLYWKINGRETSILAQGPAGKDGSTGVVYIGLTDDMKINDVVVGNVVQINILYLLSDISEGSTAYDSLSPESKSHFPFITISDWKKLSKDIANGSPIFVLGESSSPMVVDGQDLGVPYYISTLMYNEITGAACNVSEYNICYAHMNDNTVKQALLKNVLIQNPAQSGPVDEIQGYSIKERTAGDVHGYSIFVPYIDGTKNELVISYVDDVRVPAIPINNWYENKSLIRIIGSLALSETKDSVSVEGKNGLAHGRVKGQSKILAQSDGSYAGGVATDNSYIISRGVGSHAEGHNSCVFPVTDIRVTIRVQQLVDRLQSYMFFDNTKLSDDQLGEFLEYSGIKTKYILCRPITEDGQIDESKYIKYESNSAEVVYSEYPDTATRKHCLRCIYPGLTMSGISMGGESELIIKNCAIIEIGFDNRNELFSILKGLDLDPKTDPVYGGAGHAEGYHNYVLAESAHAEGSDTTAYGQASHAEGSNTTAYGQASHAEGSNTTASGQASHAEGIGTIANEAGACSMGTYNAYGRLYADSTSDSIILSDSKNSLIYALSIGGSTTATYRRSPNDDDVVIYSFGIGISDDRRQNALFITKAGSVYVYLSKHGDGGMGKSTNNGSPDTNITFYKKIS